MVLKLPNISLTLSELIKVLMLLNPDLGTLLCDFLCVKKIRQILALCDQKEMRSCPGVSIRNFSNSSVYGGCSGVGSQFVKLHTINTIIVVAIGYLTEVLFSNPVILKNSQGFNGFMQS